MMLVTSDGLRNVLILAGGDLHVDGERMELVKQSWDCVIGVDSGARHALALGLQPGLLMGDMDSIDTVMGAGARAALAEVPTRTFPTDKDKTDTHLAVDWALDQGARKIVIAGGLGSRFDHTLANAHLLTVMARQAAEGLVTDGRQAVYLLTGYLRLTAPRGFVLSVLPLGEGCQGLSERGLRWELTDFDPILGDTRTLSNQFTDQTAELRLRAGAALVITGPASA